MWILSSVHTGAYYQWLRFQMILNWMCINEVCSILDWGKKVRWIYLCILGICTHVYLNLGEISHYLEFITKIRQESLMIMKFQQEIRFVFFYLRSNQIERGKWKFWKTHKGTVLEVWSCHGMSRSMNVIFIIINASQISLCSINASLHCENPQLILLLIRLFLISIVRKL